MVSNASKLWIVVLFALTCSNAWAQYPAHVKFLSYNLWGYRNAEIPGGYDRLASVINELNPDISGHQEVDFKNDRSKGIDVIAYLGKRTKMHPVFAPGLKDYQNGQYGEGLLSDRPALKKKLFWIEQPGGEDRSAIEIEITMAGEKVRILTTHLAHEGNDFRARQAKEMVEWINKGGDPKTPMVIMGDFNSRPGDRAMSQYEKAGFEYVRNAKGEILDTIDHIMYRPKERWRLIEAGKPTHYKSSDHDPVWAILELVNQPPKK
ncbi:MAG: hypothetical protein HOI66_18210 [Verrucomicrobia bacterium]|jgi:endonuclease/exonuclease/phosphatase family metal-dependent hydrolase|nr:hypothetical protein [Verrucomicrobiota bacterium]